MKLLKHALLISLIVLALSITAFAGPEHIEPVANRIIYILNYICTNIK